MKSLRVLACVLVLCFSAMSFSQSEKEKPEAPKSGSQVDKVPKEIVLIGEMHGTREMPRLFGNLVTVAVGRKNQRIGVGLELPIELQRLIDEAVKNNTRIDSFREQLLADPVWQKINDGRSSEAMLELICDALQLAQSRKLSLFFFDTSNIERDLSMGQFIGQYVREQHYDVTYVLTGNIHANTAPQFPRMKTRKLVPMGYRLEEQGFTVHSYDVRYSDGEAWDCSSATDCGVHHLKGWSTIADAATTNYEGYDGLLFVGPVQASPPAHASTSAKATQ